MLPKRVLILDTGKEWGGGTNSLLELLNRIDRSNYHFTVLFYNNYKKGADSDIKTEIEKLGIDFLLLEEEKQPLVAKILKELTRAIFFFISGLKQYFLFWIDYRFRIGPNADRLKGIIERLNIDLLYMNNQPSTNLEGILAARDTGIPCIQHSRIAAKLNAFEADAANKWLIKMICVSEGVRASFIEQGINASICEVVYNGIDQNAMPSIAASEIRKKCGIGEDGVLIGTVGSLIKRKRINDLIEAVVELNNKFKTQNSKFKIIVVGDGPEKDNLQKQVLRLGLQDKALFTGFRSDAISYINAMDIFVLPSEKEGLPRVILEAMLMRKPVVACDTTGSSDLVVEGTTGFLVPVKKPEIIADAILKLIASSDLRSRMGEKGRELVVERFSIEKYIDGVNNAFKEALD